MTELQKYLAEEVAEDHVDGIITRREAIRRLGLLGVGATAASAMLAAEAAAKRSGGAQSHGHGHGHGSDGRETAWAPVPSESITFAGPRGPLLGAWAPAAKARGGVLVIHENRGLTDHIRSVAGRMAASGYSALAIDLLSEEGGTGTFADSAQATAALNAAPPQRFVDDMKAGLGELLRRVPDRKAAAMGFCFGGGMVWSLLAAGEPRLGAAVPFYGPLPERADLSGSRGAAVLGIYAERDTRVNATRDAAKAALDKAGLTNEVVTYPNADHAFFNDTGARYAPEAAEAAYQRVLGWFGQHLR